LNEFFKNKLFSRKKKPVWLIIHDFVYFQRIESTE